LVIFSSYTGPTQKNPGSGQPDSKHAPLSGARDRRATLGLQWTGKLLYPDLYAFDMEEVVRRFYHLFYHIHLTEEQIHEILHHAKS
jgi:iron complex transport system substrate-binding protein